MSRSLLVVLAVFVSVCASASALQVQLAKSTAFETQARLTHAVQFSNTSICFQTSAADGDAANVVATTHCSFDGGASFEVVNNAHPMCSHDIVVDRVLFCSSDQVQQPEEGDAEYAAVSFEIRDGALQKENSEKRFVFKGSKLTGILKQVLFNGNAVHVEEEDAYIFVSTVVDEAEDKKVVAFRSEDGLVFQAISLLPSLEEAQQHYVINEGSRKLSVLSSFSAGYFASVSSGYAGKFWSSMKLLNVTTAPSSVLFPSGVLFQHAFSNESSAGAKWYVVDDKGKRAVTKDVPEISAAAAAGKLAGPLYAFATTESDGSDKKRLLVLQPAAGSGVRATLYDVDDSAEEKEKADKIAKEKEAWLKKEAASFKAKMERLEREKAQRRERRRKEAERKAQFVALDEPNVLTAKAFQEKDGELVVVRRVHKDWIALEKEVFLSDL